MQLLRNNRPISQGKLLILTAVLGLAMACAGCGPNDFNYGKVRGIIEGSPLHLDAEYVMLTQDQFKCGIAEDLWDPPDRTINLPGQTAISHVQQKGRDLKFSDDVSIGDKRYPYVQIRGDFSMSANEIVSDKDGPEENTRLVESKLAVNIQHACFHDPLPLMGVRKGQFTQDYLPVLFFRYNNGWQIDHVAH
jgi:hypothetical protein